MSTTANSDNDVVAFAILLGGIVLVGTRREHLCNRVESGARAGHLILGAGDGFVLVPVYAIQSVAAVVDVVTVPYEVYFHIKSSTGTHWSPIHTTMPDSPVVTISSSFMA